MALKLGLIGCGGIGKHHLLSVKELGYELHGAADINLAAAQEAIKPFAGAKAYPNHQEMLKDKAIEAVIVATPNKHHAEHAIAALEAGKHVFLEKPMAMNVGESDRILAARDRAKKLLQIGMVNRFNGATQALRKYIDAGRCGKIYAGQAHWYRRRGVPGFGGWFTTKSMSGGGALIDIGVHLLDLSMYLMGFPKPVAVSGQTYNVWKELNDYTYTSMWGKPVADGKKDVDDYALALIRFADGATLQLNVSWALNVEFMEPDQIVRVMGDEGGVALQGIENPHADGEEAGHLIDTKLHYMKNNPFVDEMKHFADCIAEGRLPMPAGEEGRTVQSILDAIYRSGEEGREVRLG